MPTAKKTTLPKSTKKPEKPRSKFSIDVYGLNGKIEKTLELSSEIFGVTASPTLLAQYVRVYLANQRHGTSSTKTRSEVSGTTKKVYRQKGTGRARHGAKKAPIFVGGGVTFGPQPHDYSLKMNKKQKRKALFYSLSLKAKAKGVVGLSNDSLMMKPKTKAVVNFFAHVGIGVSKVLVVVPQRKSNLYLASRNIPNVDVIAVNQINPYEILNHTKILFTESALEKLVSHFTKKHEN